MTEPSDDRPGAPAMPEIHAGGCLCGAVRYSLTGPLRPVVACHCVQCRRTSGHFAAMTSVPLERFALVAEAGLAWYRSSPTARRGFCRLCGSNLFWRPDGEARVSVTAGSLDGATGLAIERHIFVADKGDYYALGPEDRCFAAW
jgi:hypothetical protein